MTKQRNFSQNISCEEAIQRIFPYIDDYLQGTSREELEHHLETCRHCFDRVEFEKLLKSRLRKLNIQQKTNLLQKKIEAIIDKF
ncbi:MAG: zf-HC2 domain-containing protein [Ignavibacteriales bacterium]|nr:zf-HC2 domain-containing protein [Ignavibacteriales bacterium]